MLAPRELRPLLVVIALAVALGCAQTLGILGTDLLHLVPLLVLALPLLAGRYLGEDRIAALAAAVRARRPRVAAAPHVALRRPAATVARGGRLIAASLGRRGPPALLGAR